MQYTLGKKKSKMFVTCVAIFVVMKIDTFCSLSEPDDEFLKLGSTSLLLSE